MLQPYWENLKEGKRLVSILLYGGTTDRNLSCLYAESHAGIYNIVETISTNVHISKLFAWIRGGLYSGKKRVMFQFLRAPSHMKQNVAMSILTPFSSKSAKKMRRCRPKKLKWMRGSEEGSENYYLCYYFRFVPFFTSVEVDMYVFQVKESILQGFERIGHFVFPKNVVLCQIRPRGRFCGCARNLLQFRSFVTAKSKINPTEGYSENLSTLFLFVWSWHQFICNQNVLH